MKPLKWVLLASLLGVTSTSAAAASEPKRITDAQTGHQNVISKQLVGIWLVVEVFGEGVPPSWRNRSELHFSDDGKYRRIADNGYGFRTGTNGTFTIDGLKLIIADGVPESPLSPEFFIYGPELDLRFYGETRYRIRLRKIKSPDARLRDLPEPPATVEQAVSYLKRLIEPELLNRVRKAKQPDLIMFQYDVGATISQAFGLWDGNDALMKATRCRHPDEASMAILEALWKELRAAYTRNFFIFIGERKRVTFDPCG